MSYKVAVVTGAAAGIGAACSKRLAKEGVAVAVLDLDAERCADTVKAIKDAGGTAIAVGADVSNRASVKAGLEQVREALGPIWARLADFLEIHAEAEERHFYPTLLKVGTGAGGRPSADAETEDAIEDHNEIRRAVAQVAQHAVGSRAWHAAVAEANKANSEHMGEEEREGLADFRDHADLQTRHDLAIAFAAFEAVHYQGVRPVDKDPKGYVEANK